MGHYRWNNEKNEILKRERGITFEQIIMHIERGGLIEIVANPNQEKYHGQQLLVVEITKYIFLVPCVEIEAGKVLKTLIPSR